MLGSVRETLISSALVIKSRSGSRPASALFSVVAERGRLAAALSGFPDIRVFPSEANLLLVRIGRAGDGRAARAWQALQDRGILVRNFDRPGPLAGCLRITPGTPAENDLFLAELPAALG